jgi:aldehyde dehydrogenase (NAD+)
VGDAYAAAAAAAPGWRRTPGPARGQILYRAAEIVAARRDALARTLTREEGKTLPEAAGEVDRAVGLLRYFAGEASQPNGDVVPSAAAGRMLYTVGEPVGVVGAITPWNFPIAIPTWKVAPALAFGNTVVLKPSELTPLTALGLAEALTDAGLPPGVLNVVCGDPAVIGDAVTGDPELRALTFTGSGPVGRRLQAAAVARGVKVQLELGGKNPVIVCDDADLDLAVAQTVSGAMMSSGQKCTATSRIIVLPRIREAFVERLVARVEALRVGDPLEPGVDLGPVASEAQRDRVLGYLEGARADGLTLLAGGGTAPGDGWFVQPTLFDDVDPSATLAQEEVFGPVAALIAAGNLDEALAIANDVEYGLSATVFTRDLATAFSFARDVDAGVVHVNCETTGSEPQVPFGGVKASSSHSREQGKAAAEFFTRIKTVYLDAGEVAA